MPHWNDEALRKTLESYATREKDYWSFRGRAAREGAHAFFQYPAMMVPQMQAELLSLATDHDPTIGHVYDPFVGAGTVLTESMMQGLDFTGQDVNPLAILLCRTKSIPHFCNSLEQRVVAALDRARRDRKRSVEVKFPGRAKWFRPDVLLRLSRIRRSIMAEPALWARRFLWVALAETVRLTSNSRTSTVKLHMRPASEIRDRLIPVMEVFETVCSRNLAHLLRQKVVLSDRHLLRNGVYCGRIETRLGDSALPFQPDGHERKFDLLLTSPPYGDNTSTIPYGQHSYLPLCWVDLADIDQALEPSCLRTTHEIDSRSLGGIGPVSMADLDLLRELSPAVCRTLERLQHEPPDRARRVAAFCRDINRCIDPITHQLRPNALMIWIIGNRSVGGQPVPMDEILTQLLRSRGVRDVSIIHRRILRKRHAVRNNIAATMNRESIVVMRNSS